MGQDQFIMVVKRSSLNLGQSRGQGPILTGKDLNLGRGWKYSRCQRDSLLYNASAIGHNILTDTTKHLRQWQASLDGYFTNQSTVATRLLKGGIDEQLIMLWTGHSTVSGVRSYKCVGEKLKLVTSDVLIE